MTMMATCHILLRQESPCFLYLKDFRLIIRERQMLQTPCLMWDSHIYGTGKTIPMKKYLLRYSLVETLTAVYI